MGFLQDVLLRLRIKGDRKVVKGLEDVSKAQKKLLGQTADASKAAEVGTENQENLNAAVSDYAGALARVNPEMGAVLASMEQLFKIGGDLGKLPLGDLLSKTTGKLKEFKGALLFTGAAGLAAGAVAVLVAQISSLNAEMAAYIAHQEEARKQAEGLATTQRSVADAYRAAANARIGFQIVGEEAGRTGGARAERLGEKLRMDPKIIATLLGQLQGLGVSPEVEMQLLAIVKAGRSIGFVQDQGAASRRGTISSAIERNRLLTGPQGIAELFGTTRGTAAGARGGGAEAPLDAREFAKKFLGIKDQKLDRLLKLLDISGGGAFESRPAINFENIASALGNPFVDAIASLLGERMGQPISPEKHVLFGPSGQKEEVTREELAELLRLISGLLQARRQEEEVEPPPPVQNYNPIFNFNGPITPDTETTDRDETEGSQ